MAALASPLLSHSSPFLSTLYWSLWRAALCHATVQSQPTCWIDPFLKADLRINRFVTGGQHRKTKFALFVFLCGILFFHVGAFIRHASHLNANLWSSAFVSPLSAVMMLMPQMLKHRTRVKEQQSLAAPESWNIDQIIIENGTMMGEVTLRL